MGDGLSREKVRFAAKTAGDVGAPERGMAEPRQILAIQYLRALAALAVVVFHNLERSDDPFVVGQAGVDLFFVISGFVMWTLADAQQPSAQAFLWRRIIRIVPLY